MDILYSTLLIARLLKYRKFIGISSHMLTLKYLFIVLLFCSEEHYSVVYYSNITQSTTCYQPTNSRGGVGYGKGSGITRRVIITP